MNQCSSHRSGTACGSCKEGYTLSFDSMECVSIGKCTTGYNITGGNIIDDTLDSYNYASVCYDILSIGIGYLYAITYYYSMLNILLNHSLYQSKGLFTAVSSIVKRTPKFIWQFCLIEDMSGIDQQFIHYIHPLAVSVIVI